MDHRGRTGPRPIGGLRKPVAPRRLSRPSRGPPGHFVPSPNPKPLRGGEAVGEQKTSVAVLFADVSDSTRLYEALGDTTAFGQVRAVIGLLQDITKMFQGR